jgi:pre-mRNA-splicing factor ATP-dependent RNA helicase DHX15/PRP43
MSKNNKNNIDNTDNIDNIGILDPNGKHNNPLNDKTYSEKYIKLASIWSKFPAYENPQKIINIIKSNQVVLITSGTGSGKTVLIPKYVLHQTNYKGHIMVSLPKQIIAQSAAEYAALTLDVTLGEQIGYKYKGSDPKYVGKDPNLLYATDGTIVARLLNDPVLTGIDAVIIDEAHERKVQIDFMLYLLRNVLKERKDFKLIIMSATVNSEIFKSYFAEYKFEQYDVGSKTNYEIKSIFPDKTAGPAEYVQKGMEIINDIIKRNESGKISDILFFVTSISETIDIAKKLRILYPNKECIEIYSGMDPVKQEELSKKQTENQRILISTNVAESSLTVDGIKYVIDSGYELTSYFEPNKRGRVLEKGLITQAQAKQRMGRAGRTAPGICYHLYTKDDFMNFMKKFPEPTIRVSNITAETLKLLNLDNIKSVDNVLKVLSSLIEPPREIYIKVALKTLRELDLITDNKINKLGEFVANSQLEPEQALSIYCAYQLRCAKDVIAILLIIDNIKNNINELFMMPTDILKDNSNPDRLKSLNNKFNEKINKLKHKYGDHLTIIKIFSKFSEIEDIEKRKQFCYDNFLKFSVLQKSREQYDRIKYRIMNIVKNTINDISEEFKIDHINNIDKIKELSIDYKILYALRFGYRLNLGFYNANHKNYRTLYTDKVNISKDSVVYNTDKPVFYHELFLTKMNSDLNIVSIIPDKIKNS